MSSIDTLKQAFCEGLGVEASDVDWENLAYRGIPEWDSVAHMAVIAEIEDAFDIMIETDDVIGMSTFPIAREIVAKYGVEIS